MTGVLVFAVTLLLAVLLSEFAGRSVLSTAVLFLAAGFVAGPAGFGWVETGDQAGAVSLVAELALFSVLFTDGMRIGFGELRKAWRLPGRALLFGLPLTLVGTAAAAHWLVGLAWAPALLLGAVLSPTDPVFAAAIVGRDEVPLRLRRLLNVESGVNDGLALPFVVALLSFTGPEPFHGARMAAELAAGIALGIVGAYVPVKLESWRVFAANQAYRPLFGVAVGVLIFAAASLTHANEYLAAFAAGVTLASASDDMHRAFRGFGELVAELFKLAALLLFGSLISWSFLASIPWQGYVFAALALFVVRPAALGLALLRSPLGVSERVAAAWFGPKGFASVVYGLLIFRELVRGGEGGLGNELFHLAALVVVGSIVAHSSTDVLVARWFERHGPAAVSTGRS